jgi:ABC-type lipoprotein release transport system permease subunit
LTGVGLAYGLTPVLNWMSRQSFMSYFLDGYTLDPVVASVAIGVGTAVSFLAAFLPCLRVARLPIVSTIRRVA